MPPNLAMDLDEERVQKYAVFVFAFLAFFAKLWEGPLGGDESCYALLAREILRTGDWLVLHHTAVPEWSNYYEHPPLYMWMTALSFKLFGIGDFAAKVSSALTGFGAVIAIYYAARKMRDHRFAVLASAILTTTIYFVDYGRKARLENPLTFFMVLSFCALVFALKDRRPSRSALSGAALALAFLTKGAPALAGGIIAAFAIGFFADTWRLRLRHGVMLLLGAGTLLVPWALAQFLMDEGRFFDWYVNKQVSFSVAGRVGPEHHRPLTLSSWLFYPKILLTKVMVPGAAVGYLGALGVLWRRQFRADYFEHVAIIAVVVVVGAFTVIPHQMPRYVLPTVPFLALLGARFLYGFSWGEHAARWAARVLIVASVLMALTATLTPIPFYTKKDGDFLPFSSLVREACTPSEPLLVGGMLQYTVDQVFTWYFDRPSTRAADADEFVREWQSGSYPAAVYRTSGHDDPDAWDFLRPFAKNGRYVLFLREEPDRPMPLLPH